MPVRTGPITVSVLLALGLTTAAGGETRGLGAHVHGHVSLEVSVDGPDVRMTLEAPGADVVGFEHAAETDAQREAVEAARADLADPMTLFVLPEAAGCTGEAAEVALHQDGDHNAFEAEYALTCDDPSALTEIGTAIFDLYPSVQEIDFAYVTPAGQGATTLGRGSALTLPTR